MPSKGHNALALHRGRPSASDSSASASTINILQGPKGGGGAGGGGGRLIRFGFLFIFVRGGPLALLLVLFEMPLPGCFWITARPALVANGNDFTFGGFLGLESTLLPNLYRARPEEGAFGCHPTQ